MRLFAVLAAATILSACASRPEPIVVVSTPAPVVALVPVQTEISPINRALSPAASVWHFRVALNVAALACRGASEALIVARYNALLAGQKTVLTTAETTLAAEYRTSGGAAWRDAYDDSMTRLYNFFSQAQARTRFCTAAETVLGEVQGIAPTALPAFAADRLAMLDAPFVEAFGPVAPLSRPVIAIAATMPERVDPQTPRLNIDIAALNRE